MSVLFIPVHSRVSFMTSFIWPLCVLLNMSLCTSGVNAEEKNPSRDFTFCMSSDSHLDKEDLSAKKTVTRQQSAQMVRASLQRMMGFVGKPWPAIAGITTQKNELIAVPRGVWVAGDMTENKDWSLLSSVLPSTGIPIPGVSGTTVPIFYCMGNHDEGIDSPIGKGMRAINEQRVGTRLIEVADSNSFNYAWTYQGVHIVCVNLCPADAMDPAAPCKNKMGPLLPRGWNDPMGAYSFLEKYLLEKVGKSGDPVMIVSHYGFCEGFNFNDDYWSAKQRRTFYELIKDYNIVALLHGHSHVTARYRWPDPVRGAKEVKRLFGKNPPTTLRSFDVFSAGMLRSGQFYLFRVTDDRLTAAHFDGSIWSTNAELHASIPISSGSNKAAAK